MNPYTDFVSGFARLVVDGRSLPLGGFPPVSRPKIGPAAPKALFFAPHPDDETVGGGLALRLLREARWNVIDASVTLGRLPERKAARLQELKGACGYLGFGLAQLAPNGLDNVNPVTRAKDPSAWSRKIEAAVKILAEHQPRVVFLPHELDWNSTHIGVHYLVMDALKAVKDLKCYLVEMEFWGQMQSPNLLVEFSAEEVSELAAATSFHAGEVRRNPYHLLLPAWMQDNVRRGSELVGGQGQAAAHFMFAQVYRLRRWNISQVEEMYSGGRFLPSSANAASLFV
ncbi:MAG: PIG-L family deacetylase [Verrucomicrobiota bacterium]|jgi:LmbE family N-acetylglucosaminyl deacetylase